MLTARALVKSDSPARRFDARLADIRTVTGPAGEHVIIDLGDNVVRLDIVEGTTRVGPISLRFELADDDRLAAKLAALSGLRGLAMRGQCQSRLASKLLALQAVDARDAGASLRETAELLLGAGDWPGDGEHRKSQVRRLLNTGAHMIRSGPSAILEMN